VRAAMASRCALRHVTSVLAWLQKLQHVKQISVPSPVQLESRSMLS